MSKKKFKISFTYEAEILLDEKEAYAIRRKIGAYEPEKGEELECQIARDNMGKDIETLKGALDNIFLMNDGRTETSEIKDGVFEFKDVI